MSFQHSDVINFTWQVKMTDSHRCAHTKGGYMPEISYPVKTPCIQISFTIENHAFPGDTKRDLAGRAISDSMSQTPTATAFPHNPDFSKFRLGKIKVGY